MRFPETRHSAILGLRDAEESVRRQSYEAVIAAYWQPVQKYLRLRWHEPERTRTTWPRLSFRRHSNRSCFLATIRPRALFEPTYDHHLLNARKQNGRAHAVPLDFDTAASGEPPEELFHREFVRTLFSLAIEDVRAAADELRFRAFERYDLNESDARPTYQELANELGTTTICVTNYLAAIRRDFRRAVLRRLQELTATEREYRLEARVILGVEV